GRPVSDLPLWAGARRPRGVVALPPARRRGRDGAARRDPATRAGGTTPCPWHCDPVRSRGGRASRTMARFSADDADDGWAIDPVFLARADGDGVVRRPVAVAADLGPRHVGPSRPAGRDALVLLHG